MKEDDVPKSWADVSALGSWVGWRPETLLETGVGRFMEWYREYDE